MEKTLKIVIMGPQGSGKGTQAELISEKYNISKVTIGDILRKNIKEQTELGKKAEEFTNKGLLMPDDIINQIVADRLSQEDAKAGFILDGYPRNKNQLEALEKIVELSHAIEIKVSDDLSVERLGGRRSCKNCGAIYHVENKPPKEENVCDECGGELYIRDDDKPEAIKQRLDIYHKETEPLLDYYREKGILLEVNGEHTIEEVFKEIKKELEK